MPSAGSLQMTGVYHLLLKSYKLFLMMRSKAAPEWVFVVLILFLIACVIFVVHAAPAPVFQCFPINCSVFTQYRTSCVFEE